MKILINDLMQFSDLPEELQTPSLADRYNNNGDLIVNFSIPSDYLDFDVYDGVLSYPSKNRSQPMVIDPTFTDTLIDDNFGVQDDKFSTALYIEDDNGALIVPSSDPRNTLGVDCELTADLDLGTNSVSFSMKDWESSRTSYGEFLIIMNSNNNRLLRIQNDGGPYWSVGIYDNTGGYSTGIGFNFNEESIYTLSVNSLTTTLYENSTIKISSNISRSNGLGEMYCYSLNDLQYTLTNLTTTKQITYNNTYETFLSQPLTATGANTFDCIGIGGTDATEITINDTVIVKSDDGGAFADGLYELGQSVTASTITINHNGTYMGRIAVGTCHEMCISPSREPGFYTSVKPRRSLSGQVIPTAGGYGGAVMGVDFRYKINREIIEDFRRAYVTQTMQGFPFFLDFDNDDWLPFNKFYGETDNSLIFQSSINGFKYSKRFEFKQAF